MTSPKRPTDTQKYAASQHKLRQRYLKQQARRRAAMMSGQPYDEAPSFERDMQRVNGMVYTLLLPVFFVTIVVISIVLGSIPVLLLLRLHGC